MRLLTAFALLAALPLASLPAQASDAPAPGYEVRYDAAGVPESVCVPWADWTELLPRAVVADPIADVAKTPVVVPPEPATDTKILTWMLVVGSSLAVGVGAGYFVGQAAR